MASSHAESVNSLLALEKRQSGGVDCIRTATVSSWSDKVPVKNIQNRIWRQTVCCFRGRTECQSFKFISESQKMWCSGEEGVMGGGIRRLIHELVVNTLTPRPWGLVFVGLRLLCVRVHHRRPGWWVSQAEPKMVHLYFNSRSAWWRTSAPKWFPDTQNRFMSSIKLIPVRPQVSLDHVLHLKSLPNLLIPALAVVHAEEKIQFFQTETVQWNPALDPLTALGKHYCPCPSLLDWATIASWKHCVLIVLLSCFLSNRMMQFNLF